VIHLPLFSAAQMGKRRVKNARTRQWKFLKEEELKQDKKTSTTPIHTVPPMPVLPIVPPIQFVPVNVPVSIPLLIRQGPPGLPLPHCTFSYDISFDSKLQERIFQNPEWVKCLLEASATGARKHDYGNGFIKVVLTGDYQMKWGKYVPRRYRHWSAGIRVFGKRRSINNGVQQIELFQIVDEQTEKSTYNSLVHMYAKPMVEGSYFGGRPCRSGPDYDENVLKDRNKVINSTQIFI